MVFWFRGSPSIFISMETTAAFGVDDSRSSFCAWKLESSKVSLEWGNFEVFQKTLRGEKLDVFGKLSKAMQISPDNPSLGRVFQMRTLMCSSKALPTQHSFVRNKKGQVRAYGLHMASCGSLFGYIFCELCFRLHKISWTKSSGLFHKYWRDLKEFYVLFWLVWSGQETTKHSFRLLPRASLWMSWVPKSSPNRELGMTGMGIVSLLESNTPLQTGRTYTFWSTEAAVKIPGIRD